MSLVQSASLWNNEDSNVSKKRISTMKPAIRRDMGSIESKNTEKEGFQQTNEQRNEKIHGLLNQMSFAENDGSKLANFRPPPNPQYFQRKKDTLSRTEGMEMSPEDLLPQRSLHAVAPIYSNTYEKAKVGEFHANQQGSDKYSNYRTTYSQDFITPQQQVPYYAKMGMGNQGKLDDKLMEKLNYLIHLMEEQKMDKTNNIMEEFLLYSFLGIFIIYIADSFARAGKYIR